MRALAALVAVTVASGVADAAPPKRAMPVYDGRPDTPTTGADVARTALRLILLPFRVVANYAVRWPAGKLVTSAEHSRRVRSVIHNMFMLPATPTPSIYPVVFYDFGFQSSIGVRGVWGAGFMSPGSKLSWKLGTGGVDWLRADGEVVIAAPKRFHGLRVGFEGGARRRPDQQFFGIGSESPQSAAARYLHVRSAVTAFAGWRELSVFATTAASYTGKSNFSDDPSIDDQVAAGRIAELPAGYRSLSVTERIGLTLALDTRGARDAPERDRDGNGARIDGTIEHVRDREIGAWTHIDVTVGAALRLDRVAEHKLDVRMRIELVDPESGTRASDIPFLELAAIGGSRDLRGFANGRGRGLSAASLMLDYQWPLAAWLDATLYLGAGNVFGGNLSGFSSGKLRASAGAGLAIAGLGADRQIELWSALGTDPFDDGADINSFRLVLGYTHDY